eukprot:CAMPEP_0173468744 /NCGR_PEP_ID=MMETSP1357-20121228/76997_2 /TAXON_ID=77926 /ORGANISM="Hemiselmis rufescens, Strain PCC563" /LENGTH=161 /DNA_ID=CAMNT_0014436967 /DNA_START=758 /DNA_END=1241 /DNA_ORIENTATION=-
MPHLALPPLPPTPCQQTAPAPPGGGTRRFCTPAAAPERDSRGGGRVPPPTQHTRAKGAGNGCVAVHTTHAPAPPPPPQLPAAAAPAGDTPSRTARGARVRGRQPPADEAAGWRLEGVRCASAENTLTHRAPRGNFGSQRKGKCSASLRTLATPPATHPTPT